MTTETLHYFIRWFVVPFYILKQIRNGDAAFVAFPIGLSLCERFHRIESTSQDAWTDNSFKKCAAKHLNVDEGFFEDFWDVFRNGIQHQASPKWRAGDGKDRKSYKWAIDDTYPAKPVLGTNDAGENIICVNPWSFTEHYIYLFLSNPKLLDDAVQHSFGHIFDGGKIRIVQDT